ncbi:MAG: imidazole glycerol phosphate synthase subunit HisH [Tannerella sp.]|nr:imidazole glycerol phosphate synthase subunit HisH [Tannerella sp.]
MNVAIIKYNAGNIYSVDYGLKRIGITPVITDDPQVIRSADRVIFPGQGEASTTMKYLHERGLDALICGLRQPVLGICIGIQLMCRHSDEGDVDCLGIFDAGVKRFAPQRHEDKVPHIGWNSLSNMRGALFEGLPANPYVYFVHSYYIPVTAETSAVNDYITPFSAAMQKDNFYATQFHPEKSGAIGEIILGNFINLR